MNARAATLERSTKRHAAAAPVPVVSTPTVGHAMVLETTAEGLVLFDVERRTYLGLGRDGTYWHYIQPAGAHEYLVRHGSLREGQLTCSCASGRVRGGCYWTLKAEGFEAQADASWFGVPS